MKQIWVVVLICLSIHIGGVNSQPAQNPYIELEKLTVISQPAISDYYSLTSRMGGEEGQVVVRVLINEGGSVDRVDLMSSSKYSSLDSAAIELSKKYQFKPFLISGNPSKVNSYLLIKFSAPDPSPSPLVRVETITSDNCKLIEYQTTANVDYKANMSAVWSGKCVNGLLSGEGVLTLTMKDGGKQIFKGEMLNGMLHGSITTSDKRVNGTQSWIEGIASNGILVSAKSETFFNGKLLLTYDGEFKDGRRTGAGRLTRSNGQIEEGTFYNGKLNGKGKITYKDGETLESDSFKSGSIEGGAILKKPSGQKYKIEYKNGKKISEVPVN
ncbi:TonB family protein [Polynucleobacter asymbioticus]|uniref:TonB family protein n=1 Tax=Polynucleobacter asymbioticus TaxID=576611 RepID=UPI0008F8F401|nr:TonB family protein [Polynucleobacter asymbioticus]